MGTHPIFESDLDCLTERSKEMTLEVGYWNLRGLVGFIRLIDVYTGENIKWVNYEVAEYYKWVEEKSKNEAGFDFPNLPWMKDGDLKISQSLAILKYVARRHKLANEESPESLAMSDMIEQQIIDSRSAFGKFNYGGQIEDDVFNNETLKPQFSSWNKFLNDKEFLNGKLSYLDFLFWEYLKHVSLVFPATLKENATLHAYYKRFANIPSILAYLDSENFQVSPISGPKAKYGGDDTLKRTEKLY